MPSINQITHPEPLTQQKVNFFADYFDYVTSQIGRSDELEIENYLSLVEKSLFQIETNFKHCAKYLESYFSHPLFNSNSPFFKEFSSFNVIHSFFESFLQIPRNDKNEKVKWFKNNPTFIQCLKSFRDELKEVMFVNASKSIIKCLLCTCPLEKHTDEIKHYTRILVSEFLLNNRSQSDLYQVFDRIISKELTQIPFPEELTQLYKKEDLEDAKKQFLENRTFQDQFHGIFTILKEKQKERNYLFRIVNISAPNDFEFTYNKVTFYHPEHTKLSEIRNQCNADDRSIKEFFTIPKMLIAVIKVDYNSSEIGENEAINTIKSELEYLNYICGSNGHLEIFSFITTSDFKSTSWRRGYRDKGYTIGASDILQLQYSIYNQLKNVNSAPKEEFLKHEALYLKAQVSGNMADYWHYLEALIPDNEKGINQIVSVVSAILVIKCEETNQHYKNRSIGELVGSHDFMPEVIGLTSERHTYYYGIIGSGKELSIAEISREVKHDFINHLIQNYNLEYDKPRLSEIHKYYERVLWELQAQRNSIVHLGYGFEPSLVMLNGTAPFLIARFRKILIKRINENIDSSLKELILNLVVEGEKIFK